MDVEQIIYILDGEARVAYHLGIHQNAIRYWYIIERIPKKYHKALVKLGKGKITTQHLNKNNAAKTK